MTIGEDGASLAKTPDVLGADIAFAREQRASAGLDGPFEVAVYGQAGLGGFGPADFEAVGATWWLESVSGLRGSLDDLLRFAEAGPPRS